MDIGTNSYFALLEGNAWVIHYGKVINKIPKMQPTANVSEKYGIEYIYVFECQGINTTYVKFVSQTVINDILSSECNNDILKIFDHYKREIYFGESIIKCLTNI